MIKNNVEKIEADEISKKTRNVYLKQHKKYIEDDVIFSRFLKMCSDPSYYYLTKEDFKGMKILDSGCGNSAYLEVAMYNFGVGHMTCLDLGDEWIQPLSEALMKFGIPDDTVDYVSGSTDNLPFQDNRFDMVISNGVLQHLYDLNQVKKAFKELGRVTKSGGYLYIVLSTPGGLFEKELIPAVRRFYRGNSDFKELIDNITPQTFVDLFESIAKGMKEHTGEVFNYNQLEKLFDLDLCTTLQNLLQVPKRHTLELDEKFAFDQYKKYDFEKPKRCRRFVVRENIRKYFAPLHYDIENKFSKLLYGPGNLEFIARKR